MIGEFPDGIVIYGAGDQARVNRPILRRLGARVVAAIDDTPDLQTPFPEIPLLRGLGELRAWLAARDRRRLGFIVAIGDSFGDVRMRLHDTLVAEGLSPVSFADPSAIIGDDVVIGDGAQIMPGVVIQTRARLGRQVILNTRASIDHDCVIGDGVEIAPGAVLCGRVEVGRHSWICTGATVVSRVRIGAGSVVGAGATVLTDVPDGTFVAGTPATARNGKIIEEMRGRRP